MQTNTLLEQLFPDGWILHAETPEFFDGTAQVGPGPVQFIGTSDAAEVGVDLALTMAKCVLDTVHHHPGRPIVFLLDTQGQRLRRRDELLGLNGYMAHLAKCVELARSRGHLILSLVYGQAVSGGYLTTGMMADACFALAEAEIKVMNLPAMARITKIPLERLEALAAQSPVFSPGVENYYRMGHVNTVWEGDLAGRLAAAIAGLRGQSLADTRRELGRERGGRSHAATVVERVLAHA
ncbi:MAG: biotin-independent malonate decarboxylase subunit gamma [Rhodocyclaceae bacterium]|nr:biotin-independent malonate decarboxylase subunit gamma [Rhodocyclaceae bacterium]